MSIRVLEVNVDDLNAGGVYALIKNVVEHGDSKIKIDICAIEKFQNKKNVEFFEQRGCNVHYVGYEKNKVIKQVVCIKNEIKLFKREKYDSVHIHADTANKLLVSGLAAKIAGVKHIIFHSHSSNVDGNHRPLKTAIHKVCKFFLPYIGNEFVACSDLAAAWMYNKRIKNVIIIKNGIDLDRFAFDEEIRRKIRSKLGINEELIIGHVGRFAYQKNHEYIIKILERLVKTNDRVKALFVGDGPLRKEIENKVKQKNLSKNVIFVGMTNNVNEILQAFDIFILPSRFEGLPIVGVEAQASGLKTVLSDKITRETKVLDDVEFLPIEDQFIGDWCKTILNCDNNNLSKRYGAKKEMEAKGFSIFFTIKQFERLYINSNKRMVEKK